MRLFIASGIESIILSEIEKIQDMLKKSDASVKWVKPSNMHFTYHFLGSTGEEKIAVLKQMIADCKDIKSFEIKFTSIEAFPTFEKPRVLWLAIEDKTKSMPKIYERLKEKLLALGFPAEQRNYVSHLTIGRIKGSKNLNILKEKISTFAVNLPKVHIKKVSLIESSLSAEGPSYREIFSVNLK